MGRKALGWVEETSTEVISPHVFQANRVEGFCFGTRYMFVGLCQGVCQHPTAQLVAACPHTLAECHSAVGW